MNVFYGVEETEPSEQLVVEKLERSRQKVSGKERCEGMAVGTSVLKLANCHERYPFSPDSVRSRKAFFPAATSGTWSAWRGRVWPHSGKGRDRCEGWRSE